MQVTSENLPFVAEGMRAELPGQMRALESVLNQPYRSPAALNA